MAEDDRLTKAERRDQARAERRRKEAEEAARSKRRRAISIVVGLLITAFVAWVLWLAFAGGSETIDEPKIIDPQAAAEARTAAACVPMEADLTAPSSHFEPAEAPPADALYTLRPTANGPHFNRTASPGVYRNGVDERAVTHSMEHGAVVVWYDPDLVGGETVNQLASWAEVLNGSGFTNTTGGSGIFVTPFEGAFTSGKPLALRAWGAALDCDSWEEIVGDAFVVDHFGTHGFGPEAGSFARFPEGTLIFGPGSDQTEVPDGGPAPAPGEPTDGESPAEGTDDQGTDEGAEDGDGATDAATDDASPDASPEPSPTAG